METKLPSVTNLAAYLIATALTCIILAWILNQTSFQYNVPLNYTGDGLMINTLIKSIVDTHHYTINPFLGAPLQSNISDFPIYGVFIFLVVKFIALFSHDYATVLNTFYFSTFIFITWFSLFVFRQLGLSRVFSIVASILFSFLPFHLMRNESHLVLSIYFCVPIYTLLAISIYKTTSLSEKSPVKISYIILCIIAALSSVSAGAYFIFFGLCILFLAGITASLSRNDAEPLYASSVFIAITLMTAFLSTLPYIESTIKHGSNPEIGHRTPREAENFPLKITQLLLPVDDNRLAPLRNIKEYYNTTAPAVNENRTATLGIIGSMGFIALIVILLLRKFDENETLFGLSIFNISLVLLSVLGGFGSLLAYAIFPTIRSYNRVSVFIAFFSLCAFFLLLENWLKQKSIPKKFYYVIATVILTMGLLDQIPQHPFINETTNALQYHNDAIFIHKIEAAMPVSSMIFQLPNTIFPEGPAVYHTSNYDNARGYLHSHTLRWSYQAMRGYPLSTWQQTVSQKPVKEMLNELAFAGFTGLYIDRNGYRDKGASIEKQMTSLVHAKPIVNPDKREVFYDLRKYVIQLKKSLGPKIWAKNVAETYRQINTNPSWWST